MKQKLILTMFALSFLAVSLVGQTIKIGVGGGYTALSGDNSFTAEDILNLSSGAHYGAKLVVGVPLLPKFVGNIYQNTLSSDVTSDQEKYTTETSFLSIGLGAEMNLLPGPLQPYLAAELLFTTFGDPKINDVVYEKSESKTGIGLGAGVYFKLLPIIDLDLSAHYNMNTLLSDGDALNSTHIRLNVMFIIL